MNKKLGSRIRIAQETSPHATTDITTRLSRLDHNLQINSFIQGAKLTRGRYTMASRKLPNMSQLNLEAAAVVSERYSTRPLFFFCYLFRREQRLAPYPRRRRVWVYHDNQHTLVHVSGCPYERHNENTYLTFPPLFLHPLFYPNDGHQYSL